MVWVDGMCTQGGVCVQRVTATDIHAPEVARIRTKGHMR